MAGDITGWSEFNPTGAPSIPIHVWYDYTRSGSTMTYWIHIDVSAVTGDHYFGWPIDVDLAFNWSYVVTGHEIKSASNSQWNAFTYTFGPYSCSVGAVPSVEVRVHTYCASVSGKGFDTGDFMMGGPSATAPGLPEWGPYTSISSGLAGATVDLTWGGGGYFGDYSSVSGSGCDVQYSTNDGASWGDLGKANGQPGNSGWSHRTTIPNIPGGRVKYRVRMVNNYGLAGGWIESGYVNCLGASLFGSLTSFAADAATVTVPYNITVYNTSFTHTVSLYTSDGTLIAQRTGQTLTNGSNSFDLTTAERKALLAKFPAAQSIGVYLNVITYSSGTNIGNSTSNTTSATTSQTLSHPTLPSFTFKDRQKIQTTISAAIAIGATTFTVASASGMAADMPFLIGTEYGIIKSISSNTITPYMPLTVAHNSGAAITVGSYAVTQNDQWLVLGKGTLSVTPATATVATDSGATITKYIAEVVGDVSATLTSATGSAFDLPNPTKAGALTLRVTAYDSRGYTDYKDVTLNVASHSTAFVIASQSSLARTGYGTTTQAIVKGAISQILINGTNMNYSSTLPMWYRYKLTTDANYPTTWTNVTSSDGVTGNTAFSYSNASIAGDSGANGFGQANDYNVQFAIMDKFSYILFEFTLPKAIPVASILNQKIGINTPNPTEALEITGNEKVSGSITAGSESVLGALTVAGTLSGDGFTALITAIKNAVKLEENPVGTLVYNITGANPSGYIGGTWVAWGAGRVPKGMGSNGTTNYATVEATGGSEVHQHRSPFGLGTSNGAGGRIGGPWNYDAYGMASSTDSFPNHEQPGAGDAGAISGYAYLTSRTSNLDPYETCYIWKRTA